MARLTKKQQAANIEKLLGADKPVRKKFRKPRKPMTAEQKAAYQAELTCLELIKVKDARLPSLTQKISSKNIVFGPSNQVLWNGQINPEGKCIPTFAVSTIFPIAVSGCDICP